MSRYISNTLRMLRGLIGPDRPCERILTYLMGPNLRIVRTLQLLEPYMMLDIANIILEYSEGFAGQFLRSERLGAKRIAALPNGEVAYVDGTLRIWNSRGTRHVGHVGPRCATCVLYLPNGMLAVGSSAGHIMIYTIGGIYTGSMWNHSESVVSLAALPNGRLASGSVDSDICVSDVESRVCLWTHHDDSAVFTLAALPSDRLASGGAGSSTIKIWRGPLLEKSLVEKDPIDAVDALATTSDGNLASASVRGHISVWDVDAGTTIYELPSNTHRVHSLLVMPGLLLSLSNNGRCYIWNTRTRELVNTIKVSTHEFDSAIVSDGQLVYVSGAHGRLVWLE
jgi:hypothetical protein